MSGWVVCVCVEGVCVRLAAEGIVDSTVPICVGGSPVSVHIAVSASVGVVCQSVGVLASLHAACSVVCPWAIHFGCVGVYCEWCVCVCVFECLCVYGWSCCVVLR